MVVGITCSVGSQKNNMKRKENGARPQLQLMIKASSIPNFSSSSKRMVSPVYTRDRSFGMSPLKLDEETPFHVDRGFQQKGKAWFAATELQSDLVVEVDDLKFHLHKFPLLSRSGRLNRLVFESRDTETDRIKLDGIPGGPESFELAAKFCYGMPIDLNASNVASLRCVAEYLEMVEELEEGNLISKTEAFLGIVVLPSWKESLTVLLSCEELYPWAENLQIVRRCSESIAWKACTDPKGRNNWPTITGRKLHASPAWYGVKESDPPTDVPQDWWFQDVSMLSLEHFSKVIAGIKAKGMKSELVGAAIMCYALKWIPGLSKSLELKSKVTTGATTVAGPGKDDFSRMQSNSRIIIEGIVGLLPPQRGAVSCKFLLHVLRIANMHNASSSCKGELEKRVGVQMEHATLTDLLIPSFSHTSETVYDVGLVRRIVEYFLALEEDATTMTSPDKSPLAVATETPKGKSGGGGGFDDSKSSTGTTTTVNGKMRVAKLLDGYLAEVAHDPQLSLASFQALAEALPVYSRTCHDGLYRAIDMYLKAHPTTNEQERKRLCKIMDCQRLSSDARFHASQNDRLPLRTVVQVLFSEHMKLKSSTYAYGSSRGGVPEGSWDTAAQDIRALRKDIEKIKDQFLELRSGYNHIKQDMEKLIRPKRRSSSSSSSWTCGWKKLGSTLASPRFFHSWRDDVPSTPDIFKSKSWR